MKHNYKKIVYIYNFIRIVYLALVQSIIQYGILVWGGIGKSNLTPLILLQKRIISTVKQLKNNVAPGIDGITTTTLKCIINAISKPLAYIP